MDVINPQDYDWYQCNIIFRNNSQKYWFRFIAKGDKDARDRVNKKVKDFNGNLKTLMLEKIVVKRYDVFKVPQSILDNYNFLRDGENELFHDRTKDFYISKEEKDKLKKERERLNSLLTRAI